MSLGGDIKWKEHRIIENFRRYAREELRHGETDWHVLILGQHYRLPTRLLDWTTSPLVATFFACVLIPGEAAPQFLDEAALYNGMMPPPNSEMIAPPITE